jgi:hypothetical protein
MTTQISLQENLPPQAAETNYPSGGLQGSNIGPITSAFLQLASTMLKLDCSYNQISMDSTELQGSFNKGQRDATTEEGHKNAMSYYAQALGSMTAGLIDGGTTAISSYQSSSLNNQLAQQSDELSQLEGLQGKIQDQMTKGPDIEMQDVNSMSKPDSSIPVNMRIREMETGNLLQSKIQYVPNEGEDPLNDQAISAASGKSLDKISDQINDQITQKTQAMNTTQNQISGKENRFRTGGDLLKQGVNAATQTAQGVFTSQASHERAAGLGDQFDQQIQSTVAQAEQKAIADNSSQVLSVFEALAQAGQALA